MGVAEKLIGNLDAAINHYRLAIAINPDYYLAYSNLGNALLAQGQVEQAIAHYRQALQIKPDYAEAKRNMDAVLRSRAVRPNP